MNNADTLSFPQSLTGGRNITVDKLTFDPCGCCPNVLGTVCMEGDLAVDNLCVDGNVGAETLIAKTGATNGVRLSDTPCLVGTGHPTLYVDNVGLHVVSPPPSVTNGQMMLSSGNRITIDTAESIEFKMADPANPTSIGYMYFSNSLSNGVGINGSFASDFGISGLTKINGSKWLPSPPLDSKGSLGDTGGSFSFNQQYIYFCYGHYTGATDIWSRIAFTDTGAW